jgi:hypothetical protein
MHSIVVGGCSSFLPPPLLAALAKVQGLCFAGTCPLTGRPTRTHNCRRRLRRASCGPVAFNVIRRLEGVGAPLLHTFGFAACKRPGCRCLSLARGSLFWGWHCFHSGKRERLHLGTWLEVFSGNAAAHAAFRTAALSNWLRPGARSSWHASSREGNCANALYGLSEFSAP